MSKDTQYGCTLFIEDFTVGDSKAMKPIIRTIAMRFCVQYGRGVARPKRPAGGGSWFHAANEVTNAVLHG